MLKVRGLVPIIRSMKSSKMNNEKSPEADAERQRPARNNSGRASAWILLLAGALATLAGTFAIDQLYDGVDRRNQAQLHVARIEAHAEGQSIAGWQTIAEGRAGSEVTRAVEEDRREISGSVQALKRLRPGDDRVSRIETSLNEYAAAVDEELRLIEAGRMEAAESVSEERVDPGFEVLNELLDSMDARYEEAARRTELYAEAGIYSMAALLSLVVAALFLRHDRARREEREAVERSEERYEIAVQGANDGIWDWNLLTGETHFSPRWKAMVGFEQHEIEDRFEEWEERVHPEDRERMKAEIRKCMSGAADLCELEHRLRHRDGSYRWVLARGASVRDTEGRPYRMVGSLTDTTERTETEEKLEKAEKRYRSLVEQAPMVTFTYTREPDGGTHISYVSPQVEALLGYFSESFEDDPEFWMSLLHPEDRERVLAENDHTDATGETFEMEYRMVRSDGRVVWVREETVLIGGEEDGTTLWRASN